MNEGELKEARILMVDDDVNSTCMMTNFLHRVGYSRLESTNDSTRAFEIVGRFRPDLILLDLQMPNIDGFQVLETLRASDDEIPVLVLTGDSSGKNKRRALAAGATEFLLKPFDISEVSLRIRNLLQAHFLRREIQQQNQLLEDRVRERTSELETALTDLRKAQQRLVQQERLSAFGEMAGGVVHDFSNVLMSVIGYSDMLLKNDKARANEKTTLEYLRIINTAGRDGAHLVSRLRDFYRPRGAADLLEAVALNEIVTESISLSKPRGANRGSENAVTVETDLAHNVTAIANAADLRQVLTNLIFNAIDAISGPGVVRLRMRSESGAAIVEVSDTGAGMSAEVRERCLEPFFTTKGENGTGLGLAMVFGIIQRHQGTLEIESEIGRGTTFRIRLPAAPSSLSTPSPITRRGGEEVRKNEVACAS